MQFSNVVLCVSIYPIMHVIISCRHRWSFLADRFSKINKRHHSVNMWIHTTYKNISVIQSGSRQWNIQFKVTTTHFVQFSHLAFHTARFANKSPGRSQKRVLEIVREFFSLLKQAACEAHNHRKFRKEWKATSKTVSVAITQSYRLLHLKRKRPARKISWKRSVKILERFAIEFSVKVTSPSRKKKVNVVSWFGFYGRAVNRKREWLNQVEFLTAIGRWFPFGVCARIAWLVIGKFYRFM